MCGGASTVPNHTLRSGGVACRMATAPVGTTTACCCASGPCTAAPCGSSTRQRDCARVTAAHAADCLVSQVATGRAPTARRSVEEILISVLSSPEDDPTSIAGELSHTPEVRTRNYHP